MLKSFKSFKSFKGDSNVSFQILCKSTTILLYRYEENIKKLLNRIFVASHSLSINSESHSGTFTKKYFFYFLFILWVNLFQYKTKNLHLPLEKSPWGAIFLAQSKIIHYLCSINSPHHDRERKNATADAVRCELRYRAHSRASSG